jgi:hypothetical protein
LTREQTKFGAICAGAAFVACSVNPLVGHSRPYSSTISVGSSSLAHQHSALTPYQFVGAAVSLVRGHLTWFKPAVCGCHAPIKIISGVIAVLWAISRRSMCTVRPFSCRRVHQLILHLATRSTLIILRLGLNGEPSFRLHRSEFLRPSSLTSNRKLIYDLLSGLTLALCMSTHRPLSLQLSHFTFYHTALYTCAHRRPTRGIQYIPSPWSNS